MKWNITLRAKLEGQLLAWPEVEGIEAETRWEAIVKTAEGFGLVQKGFPLRELSLLSQTHYVRKSRYLKG